jgi:hypothetical protein
MTIESSTMTSGYSATPFARKLGVTDAQRTWRTRCRAAWPKKSPKVETDITED